MVVKFYSLFFFSSLRRTSLLNQLHEITTKWCISSIKEMLLLPTHRRLLDVQSIPPKVPSSEVPNISRGALCVHPIWFGRHQRKSLVCLLWLHKQFYSPRPPPPSPLVHAKEKGTQFNVQVYPISVGEAGGQWKCASSCLRWNLLRVTVWKARKSIIIYEKLDENQYIKNDTLIPR